ATCGPKSLSTNTPSTERSWMLASILAGSCVPYTAWEPGWRTSPCVTVQSKTVRFVSRATSASKPSARSSSAVSTAIAAWRESIGSRLDNPPARIQGGQREALLVGRDIQRVGPGAAQRVNPLNGWFRPGGPARQLLAEVLRVRGQPGPSALDPLSRGTRVHT